MRFNICKAFSNTLKSLMLDALLISLFVYCLVTVCFPFFLTQVTVSFDITANTSGTHKFAIAYANNLSKNFYEDNTAFLQQDFKAGQAVKIKQSFKTRYLNNLRVSVEGGSSYKISNLKIEGAQSFILDSTLADGLRFLSNTVSMNRAGEVILDATNGESTGFELKEEISIQTSHTYLYIFLGSLIILLGGWTYYLKKDSYCVWYMTWRVLPLLLAFGYLLNLVFAKDLARVYRTEYTVGFLNLLHGYGSFLIFLTIVLYLIGFSIKHWAVKLLGLGALVAFLLLNEVDFFLLKELNARLALSEAVNFKLTDLPLALPLIIDYFKNLEGWLSVLIIVLAIRFTCINFTKKEGNVRRSCNFVLPAIVVVGALLFSYVLPIPGSTIYDNDFANVFKLNNSTEKKAYSATYKYLNYAPTEYTIEGLNSRKNVILVVLESFTPNESIFFGGVADHMPRLDLLAAENLSFTNFFSNGFNSDTGNFAIYSGRPYIQSERKIFEKSFYTRAMPKVFAEHGYKTQVMLSSRNVFNFDKILHAAGFNEFIDGHDSFYDKSDRLTFNSVPDHDLFANLLKLVKQNKKSSQPFFTTAITATSHAPFVMPYSHIASYVETVRYTDEEVGVLYDKLSELDYFKDGILVIVSDHRVMNPLTLDELQDYGLKALGRVPLVIIDKSFKAHSFNSRIAQDSLGGMLEFLVLDKVSLLDYQRNPIAAKFMAYAEETSKPSEFFYKAENIPTIDLLALPKEGEARKLLAKHLASDETVFYQKLGPRDEVLIFSEDNALLKLEGDDTHFMIGSSKEDDYLLKLLTWFRTK